MSAMESPPLDLAACCFARVQVELAVIHNQRVEPSHVLAGTIRTVVGIRRPRLVSPQHVPRADDGARPAQSEASSHHAYRCNEEARPLMSVVRCPRRAFTATDQHRIEVPWR